MIFVDTDHVCELILDLPLEASAVLQLLFDLFLWCFSHDFFFALLVPVCLWLCLSSPLVKVQKVIPTLPPTKSLCLSSLYIVAALYQRFR